MIIELKDGTRLININTICADMFDSKYNPIKFPTIDNLENFIEEHKGKDIRITFGINNIMIADININNIKFIDKE